MHAGLVLRRPAAGLAVAVAFAHVAFAAPASPRFTHLSVEDGLSQSSVEHILQDRRGFLWFGTQEGLNRYDGYRFTTHRARDQPGFLGDHTITALVEDRRGDMWVGTARGLYRHDPGTGRFDAVTTATAHLGILDVVEDSQGRIFFTTSDGALWRAEASGGAWAARRVEMEGLTAGASLAALARGAGSAIWAAGSDRLFRIEVAQGSRARADEVLRDLGHVRELATDPAGDVWIGRQEEELLRYRSADGRVDRFPRVPRDTLALRPSAGGQLWVGTRGRGLTRLDPKTGEIASYRHDPDDPTSLSRDDVAAIYEDGVGSLWVGAWNGGVNRLDPYAQAFRRFRHRPRIPESLPADDVITMTETPDGQLWLGSRSGLLAVGDPQSGRFRIAASLRDRDRPTALGWLGSRVLVGTRRGLLAFDRGSGREVALDEPLRALRLHERPIAVIRSGTDAAWVASRTSVCQLTQDAGSRAAVSARCFDPPIAGATSALSTLGTDRLWIGSDTGELVVAEWDGPGPPVRLRPLELGDGPGGTTSPAARGRISALHVEPTGRLWVGTRRGVGHVDPKTGASTWVDERDGLPSTNIAGIAGDSAGFVWLGTNRGLTRIDPKSGAMDHFGAPEGAQGTGYAEGAWTAGASGLLYFAGHGVTAFDPREVRANPHRPGVAFTGLEILRRPVAPRWLDPTSPLEHAIDSEGALTLDPAATVFSVEMAALHYSDPQNNRLAYRLDGFDPEWIETDAQNRVATYTRLAPGRYVLRARARTKSGLWSEREATLAIRVLPPWWRTGIAMAGWVALTLLAAGLAWAAFRRRVRVRLALQERETLRRESLTDPLTGLYNRRFLATHLQHELPKLFREIESQGPAASTSGADLLLLLVDVDEFKSINDRHSHATGDRVLANIATVIREHIRDSDLAIRWGGDEFLVVARSVDRLHAAASVERLRRAVEDLGQRLAAEGGPSGTVSIGYAAFPFLVEEPKALTWEQTLHLADHALLITKRRQRNSHTGLCARPGLTSHAVIAFLAARGEAPLPAAIEVLVPEEHEGETASP